MLDKLQNYNGTGYFSQAVADFAAQMKPGVKEKEGTDSKTIGEFSEEEWEKLLDKVDNAIEEYQADLEERKEEAMDKQKEQTESYIMGASANRDQEYEQSVMLGGSFKVMRFMKIDSMQNDTAHPTKEPDIEDTVAHITAEEAIEKLLGKKKQAPYSTMADEYGIVEYKGVAFQCDYENNRLCLGDVSNKENCITVPLEQGGCLVFNRNNVDDLVKAIGMFSPGDVNRIMRAIAQDAKLKKTQLEIEDQISGEKVLKDSKDEVEDTNEAEENRDTDIRKTLEKEDTER